MDEHQSSRRAVLAAGAAGVVASLAGGAAAQPAAPAVTGAKAGKPAAAKGDPLPAVIKVSVAGYSFRTELDKPNEPGKMSLLDLADMAARWQIDAIEPTSYYFLKEDDAYIYALKHRVFANGLEISATPIRNNFCLPAGPELKAEIAHVNKWVDICVKLGSPAIRVFAGKPDPGRSREATFKNMIAGMKEAAAYAGGKGIFLGIENHGYMTETADDVLRIVDAVDNDWFGVNLDSGNFKDNGYAQIARLAPRAVICQMKAQVAAPDGKRERVDVNRFVRILREARYRGYVALEYEDKQPREEVPLLLEQLRAAARA